MLHYFYWCTFFICYIVTVGPINVCTDFEINRYKIDKVRKYAKIMFYLTSPSRDAKRYVMRHGDCNTSDRYFDKEILKPEVSVTSGSKVMVQIVVFVFSVTLTLTYVLLFVTRTAHDVLEYPYEVSLESVQ